VEERLNKNAIGRWRTPVALLGLLTNGCGVSLAHRGWRASLQRDGDAERRDTQQPDTE
jgi:hypothetical protein